MSTWLMAKPDEVEIARGMLVRYRTAVLSMEMARWHAMSHAADSAVCAHWLRVRGAIERLSKACVCGAALHDDRGARKIVDSSSDHRHFGRDMDGEPGER